jgi:hypothetical protein
MSLGITPKLKALRNAAIVCCRSQNTVAHATLLTFDWMTGQATDGEILRSIERGR